MEDFRGNPNSTPVKRKKQPRYETIRENSKKKCDKGAEVLLSVVDDCW